MADRKKHKPDPEAARPVNDTVGETLRAARVAKKLEIDDVSQALHIRSTQIKAIEENNLDSLPGMTYAVGFVRSYANFLGLNGAEIVHRFKAEHGHTPAPSKLSFPEPITESRVPDPMMVGVGAFMAVVILVLWTVYSNVHSGGKTADKLPPAPVVTSVADSLPTTTPAVTAPVPAGTDQTATTAATPPATATAAPGTTAQPVAPAVTTTGQQPATPAVDIAQAIPPAAEPSKAALSKTAPPQTEPAAAAPDKEAAASDDSDSEDDADEVTPAKEKEDGVIQIKRGKSRITLKATEASWVQVTDVHQKILYRKVLRPGEQYSVPDQPGLLLDTANAGGLEVIVDGKRVLPIGKDGDIMRGIALDPQELKNAKSQRD